MWRTFEYKIKYLGKLRIPMKTLIENLFIEKKDTVKLASGQLLYHEHEPAHFIYCLQKGIMMTYKQHTKFGKLWLNFIKPNQVLGISALQKPFYEHNAQALGEAEVVRIPLTSLHQLLNTDPLFKLNLMQTMCKEINQAEQKGVESYNKTLKQKTVFLLLELFRAQIDHTPSPEQLYISKALLAEFTSNTLPKLEKLLQELAAAKLIGIKGEYLEILNPPMLQSLLKS